MPGPGRAGPSRTALARDCSLKPDEGLRSRAYWKEHWTGGSAPLRDSSTSLGLQAFPSDAVKTRAVTCPPVASCGYASVEVWGGGRISD